MSGGDVSFEGRMLAGKGGGAFVEVPDDVLDALGGGGRIPVSATFDGVPYRGSVARMGGRSVLGLRKDIRSSIGRDVGDLVTVVLRRDDEPRTVTVPVELERALAKSSDAKTRYEGLSYTHRREYAEWVAEGKKPETRQRRATKAVAMLEAGETR